MVRYGSMMFNVGKCPSIQVHTKHITYISVCICTCTSHIYTYYIYTHYIPKNDLEPRFPSSENLLANRMAKKLLESYVNISQNLSRKYDHQDTASFGLTVSCTGMSKRTKAVAGALRPTFAVASCEVWEVKQRNMMIYGEICN